MKNYKFSIITPSHRHTEYFDELWETIKSQTYQNWEWIIYLNGKFKEYQISNEIKSDKRVKIYNGESHSNVGYIKNKAFSLGTGDILVEVDHDDLLSLDCLDELNIAFQDDEVGFAFSEDLLYDMRGNQTPWSRENGWTEEWVEFRGNSYMKVNSFPLTSHMIGIIWYAPDHVRSWRRSFYNQIGGHNPELNICDDHELVIRSYLSTKFKFIDKILYYYRFLPDNNNTQSERLESIQVTTFDLFHKYGQLLAERDADLNQLSKIELGPVLYPKDGYTLVDVVDGNISLPDNSVGVINASHILQRIKDKQHIMSEIYRVLSDGGWAFIEVPSTDGRGAFQDPTHVSYWNQNSFQYYTNKEKAIYINNDNVRFQEFRLDTNWWDDNVAVTTVWLSAVKSDKRRPHPVRI